MKIHFNYLFVLLMLTTITGKTSAQTIDPLTLNWKELPSIPDPIGFAGSFAGTSGGALIVAGGANFPDGGAPWTGSVKKWYDKVFVLENPAGQWKEVGKLPRPLGYGVSVSWRDALVCFGGSNEEGHYADAFIIRYINGQLITEELPSMPAPIANSCGIVIGDLVYIAGGIKTPDSKSTEKNFWSLDLSNKEAQWKELPSWPGPSRMFSVAGSQDGDFYLFSGAELRDGKREYLRDAYKYKLSGVWEKIADLPHSVVAAPSTAYSDGRDQLLVFGGDDGTLAASGSQLKDKHPGFSTSILAFHPATNNWVEFGKIPTHIKENAREKPNESVWAPVTTSLVIWNGSVVIPGGEVMPATRTPRVLQAIPNHCPLP